tara:strand:+ start:126 stop:803 length:678 start_codon:yes stop_codon:yes gene_type:complete
MWPFTNSKNDKDVIKAALKKAKSSGKPAPIEGKKNHFMLKNGVEAVKEPNGRYKFLKNHNKDMKKYMANLRAKAVKARSAKAVNKADKKAAALKKCVDECKKQLGGHGGHKNFGKELNTKYLEALVKKAQKEIIKNHPYADLECPTNIRKARRMANKMARDDFARKNEKMAYRKTGKDREAIRKNDALLTEGDVHNFDDGTRSSVPQYKYKVNKPKRNMDKPKTN